jgi:uncharacterized protein YihD (DUF1040 family)
VRDPARIDRMLELLRAAWKRNPDLRLLQLFLNLRLPGDPYYTEDDWLEDELKAMARTELRMKPRPKRGAGE